MNTRKLYDKLGIVSRKSVLLLLEAVINKEKYGQLSPETMEKLNVYYDYYKELENK